MFAQELQLTPSTLNGSYYQKGAVGGARTRTQLRSDTRTTSCALTGCRVDPDVHETLEMTTVLFTEHLFYFPLDPPRGHSGWARITIRFQHLSKYGSCPTNGNTNAPPDQIHMRERV